MTCLSNFPPTINILEELKPYTGSMNFIVIEMLGSLVLIWNGVLKFTSGHGEFEGGVLNLRSDLKESEGGVINFTSGLRESEGHIYIYQEETPYKSTFLNI